MSKNKDMAKALILGLPEDVKKLIVAFAGATMDAWEIMGESEREEYDDNPAWFLGEQMLLGARTILEEEIGDGSEKD